VNIGDPMAFTAAGRARGRLPREVPRMVWFLAAVMWIPLGVATSLSRGVVALPRVMVQAVSAAMWAMRAWKGLVARLAMLEVVREGDRRTLQYFLV